MTMSHHASFPLLRNALHDAQAGAMPVASFCACWRAQHDLLAALSTRYRDVMEDLLGRLEAGSLFTEESCSFSQQDLYGSLGVWLDRAEQTLNAPQ